MTGRPAPTNDVDEQEEATRRRETNQPPPPERDRRDMDVFRILAQLLLQLKVLVWKDVDADADAFCMRLPILLRIILLKPLCDRGKNLWTTLVRSTLVDIDVTVVTVDRDRNFMSFSSLMSFSLMSIEM